MKCDLCPSKEVETAMAWPVHVEGLNKPPQMNGGNFCGACAALAWEKVSQNHFCASGAIFGEPGELDYLFGTEQ